MSKKLIWFLFSFIFLLAFCFNSCGGSSSSASAVISSFEGDVLVKKSGSTDWIQAEVKTQLFKGDVIKTGPNSRSLITFFDGSTVELEPDTQIEIKEMLKGKVKSILLKQDIGETWSKVQKLADPASRYEIETPVAVAGVRGSQMIVSVEVDGSTTVENLEGNISVIAQGVEVVIPQGSTSTVEPGQPPSAPTLNVHINPDAAGDLYDLEGKPVSGYPYLDILKEWIERDGDYWVITIELSADYPDTVDPKGIVEWDVMVDADNDINTGWQSSLLFNDLGIDYYISLSRSETQFYINAQRIMESAEPYTHTMQFNATGNIISIGFQADAIGNSNKFSYIVLARHYAEVGNTQSLIAADKIPDSYHYMISVPGP